MFQSAHDVTYNLPLRFSDGESFREGVECIDEEVGGIVFRKAYSVYVHDRVEVTGSEAANCVTLLDEQRVTRKSD